MEKLKRNCSTLAASALLLTGGYSAAGVPQSGSHLSATECRDLAAIRNNAPRTKSQNQSELSALRKAGYNPSPWHDDPHYPANLHAAQRQVDDWFKTECKH
jgi:hypothetical protein